MANKLLKETDSRGSPALEIDTPRGRKGKKGKGKATDLSFDIPVSGKRKRGMKSMSVTPSVNDDDDEERDTVSLQRLLFMFGPDVLWM